MAGSHAHGHLREHPPVPVSRGPVLLLLGFLLTCAVVTVAAVVWLWPDSSAVTALRQEAPYAAEGVRFLDADVTAVQPPCSTPEPSQDCGNITVRLEEGPEAGEERSIANVPPGVVKAGLGSGDTVRVMRIPESPPVYSFDGVKRLQPLWVMTGLFVLVVAAVARLRGMLALVSLAFGGLVLFQFILPALLAGEPAVPVALAGSSAIMFVVLYLTHGLSMRTSAALAGTLVGVGITAALGEVAVRAATLTGLADDSGALLSGFADDLAFQGLLVCALIIAGLGVLNDVTITQSSAVWELRGAAPELSRRDLYVSGMRIGRDHIASTIYTIVFAYAGAGLAVLLLLVIYDRPVLELLSTEPLAEEVVRTMATGIGLVLAVPVTTGIAALTVAGAMGSRSGGHRRDRDLAGAGEADAASRTDLRGRGDGAPAYVDRLRPPEPQ